MSFALQMFENAVAHDPEFALAHAAISIVCASYHLNYEREPAWIDRARSAGARASQLAPDLPEVLVANAYVWYIEGHYEQAVDQVRRAIDMKQDCEGAYYLLGRALFAAGRYQDVVEIMDQALEVAVEDYNIYVPIENALGALGKKEAIAKIHQRRVQSLELHVRNVPEDARARTHLALDYVAMGREDDAIREANLAMALRANEATILYNVACIFAQLARKDEAMGALKKAYDAGFKDSVWVRRDPDLSGLHGRPDFEQLYPEVPAKND
jgi:tetratricopeptide (TPR) repeat protein